MSSTLDSQSVGRSFGGVLMGTRRRLIPSPSTHLPSSSRRTSTRRTQRSPSIGSVFSPPVLLHRSIRDRPASSSLIPSIPFHPFDPSISLDFLCSSSDPQKNLHRP
ncbi:hypothetical protein CROQUDRAFT_650504 [Cronartium quercuum f. sp. fusiforme G11]|uniref:Uncharacterized protein n=1 Tax=Cronartium quercuum f. sp. fusiforme G11 TaxID=708437 RepID=A0A9P6NUM1_9BASI|nr:hypothetical protein CROQUDRAFT_650504 [Cronartium quercuum f. sp. fusiforme G11]